MSRFLSSWLRALIRGIAGRSEVYSDRIPAFLKHHGRKAAGLRSADLSKMARDANGCIERYPWGMDKGVIDRRRANRERILDFFNGVETDWGDWKWHTRHIIRDAETLGRLVGLSDREEAGECARFS